MNILVTGSDGQLGQELRVVSKNFSRHIFYFTNRNRLDITNQLAVAKFIDENNIAVCINTAAYTAVDKAENEQKKANDINHLAVRNLAEICKDKNVILIHISTDFVFNGEKNQPYTEDDITNPLSIYGKTKLEGEEAALAIHDKVYIVRTSWVYSSFGKNFVKTILKIATANEIINVVNDQTGSPTYARDLAEVIYQIVDNTENVPFGIYNYCNASAISWHEFAKEIVNQSGISCRVNPIPTKDYPTPAKRPVYSVLDTFKITNALQIDIPDWKHSLKRCLELIKYENA